MEFPKLVKLDLRDWLYWTLRIDLAMNREYNKLNKIALLDDEDRSDWISNINVYDEWPLTIIRPIKRF